MASQTLAPETIVGSRFQVEQLIGNGGLGSLYLARDRETEEQVALRVLAPDVARSEVAVDQLRSQVRRASKLAHKNVARTFGMGKHGSVRYLACEYVEGHSLREVIERKRRAGKVFSLKSAYNVMAHVCNALRAALQMGLSPALLHGLPGPGSIRISRAGRVKLCDFGIVGALPAGAAAIERLGDHYCIAPDIEISPSSATPAADIYTLGMVLYELISGHPPSGHYAPLSEIVPSVPPETDQIISRCLQTDPSLRFGDPEELKIAVYEALQTALNEPEPTSDPRSTPPAASEYAARGTGATSIPYVAEEAPSANLANTLDENPAAFQPTLELGNEPEAALHAVQTSPPAPPSDSIPPQPILAPIPRGATGPYQVHPIGPSAGAGTPLATNPAQPLARVATGPMAGPAQPGFAATMAAPQPPRIEDLLAAPVADDSECWLVQKGGLDFGPFALGEVKQQLYRGEFTGEDNLLDQDSGQRFTIGRHPALEEFVRLLDVHRENEASERTRAESMGRAKRRRAIVVTTSSLSLAALAVSGVTFYLLTRKPEVVVREVKVPGETRLKLDITWKNEPKAQAAKRKALLRKRRSRRKKAGRRSPANDENVTYLGDASKAGGDQLLSQQQIQSVMEKNVQKLAKCVLQQARRDPSLRRASIDFGVRGSGQVSYIRVNGEREGPFHSCIAKAMRQIQFPHYDGSQTRASFAMNIGR